MRNLRSQFFTGAAARRARPVRFQEPRDRLRSIGLLLATAAVLFPIGGLIQINPIWQLGPYHPYLSENGAQPDWYIGGLIGALRLMPNLEPAIGNHTIVPNPFWGGAFFPLVVFTTMFAWPWLQRRFTGDQRRHDLLDRPRDLPIRSAIGAAFLRWVGDHLCGRVDRPTVLPSAYLIRRADRLLADRRVGDPDRGLLPHPERVSCPGSAAGRIRCAAGRAAWSAGSITGAWWSWPRARSELTRRLPSRR
jgi:hypothetical protein